MLYNRAPLLHLLVGGRAVSNLRFPRAYRLASGLPTLLPQNGESDLGYCVLTTNLSRFLSVLFMYFVSVCLRARYLL